MVLNVFLTPSSFGAEGWEMNALSSCWESPLSGVTRSFKRRWWTFYGGAFHYWGSEHKFVRLELTSRNRPKPPNASYRVLIIYRMCFFLLLLCYLFFNCVIKARPPLQQGSEPFKTVTKQGKDSDCMENLKVASICQSDECVFSGSWFKEEQ